MYIDRPIAIALIIFTIILLVFFLVWPEYKTLGELQTSLGRKIAEYNAQTGYYGEIEKTYLELQSRKDDIEKINEALPAAELDPTFGKLIYYLQGVADDNGLVAKNIFLSETNSTVAGAASIKNISFSMDLLGEYSSLEGFLIALEKSARIFEVESVSFGASSGTLLNNYNVKIVTHSY